MLNISQQSRLPYLEIKDFIILLDTGSSINLINKSFVYKNKEKFKIFNENFEFHTATGRTTGNEFVFIKINNELIKCYLFNFHKRFNVLLGVPTIKELGIKWDINKDLITLGNEVLKLKYFGEQKLKIKNNNNNFEIINTDDNIFEKNQNVVHCISNDKALNSGFAEQINSRFNSKEFLKGRCGKLIPQPIYKNKLLIHLVTKENYYDKTTLENISKCLSNLKEYCVSNDIFELHMPRICSGHDKVNFKLILEKIELIFKETHIKIFIHERKHEININDNSSILAQIDEEEVKSNSLYTVHSDTENDLNNITFREGSINTGKNQVIMSVHNNETEIRILKLFKNSKQRFIVKFNEQNLNNEIANFIKDYLAPKCKYLCLIEENLCIKIGQILMENFQKESYKLIKCETLLEDVESLEEQKEILINYHEGKTNHRGILETYQKLKRKYYWPNIFNDIQKYINNCDICQNNKYERKPIQIDDNLTQTPCKPFQKINIDTLTLERKKYLTIIDQFSKFAQVYYLRNANATTIVDKLINYFNNYTVPDEIIHDAGTEFDNNLVRELLKMYKVKPHMTCIANPKSNGIIEKFHCTLIEHIRIINQRNEFKNVSKENKIKLSLIAYNESINQITNCTPKEILFGKIKNNLPFEVNDSNDDYLNQHKNNLRIIHEIIKGKIENEKFKRKEQNFDTPDNLPNKVKLKVNVRNIQKVKKPLYKSQDVVEYKNKLGVIKSSNNKKYKIDKIKRPRKYVTVEQNVSGHNSEIDEM